MKVVVFVKATKNSEAGMMPTTELITAMMNYNEELVKAGIMKGGDGLKPSAKGVRIRFDGDARTVTNGPFAETSELVAGYWLWEVKDMMEAIAWAKRCPSPMPGEVSDLEIRPVYEPEDFGEAFTPELRDQYDALVEQEKAQQR
ncbi:MAG: YciI family protein [Pseudomonadota bacterium]|nr:YciI family protein [Pseudomonadota bacterium]